MEPIEKYTTRIEKYRELRRQVESDSLFLKQRKEMINITAFYEKQFSFLLSDETKQRLQAVNDNFLLEPFGLEQYLPSKVNLGKIEYDLISLKNQLQSLKTNQGYSEKFLEMPYVKTYRHNYLDAMVTNANVNNLNYAKNQKLFQEIIAQNHEYKIKAREFKYEQINAISEVDVDQKQMDIGEVQNYIKSIKKLLKKNQHLNLQLFKTVRRFKSTGRWIFNLIPLILFITALCFGIAAFSK